MSLPSVTDATSPISAPAVIAADRPGVRCSPSRCVEANALRRLPGVLDARVGARVMKLLRRKGWVRYDIERNTQTTIVAYDNANESVPVGFVGRFVPPAKPLGSRSGEKPGTDKRSAARTSVATRRPSHRHLDVEPS